MANKWVYLFSEGDATMRNLLGGKGANLAEMTKLRPSGTAGLYHHYRGLHTVLRGRTGRSTMRSWLRSWSHIAKMEEITGKKFGDKENPLLVSVRSGARASMPGMMDTILNLGLNEEVVEVLAREVRQSALGLGLLQKIHPDVLRRSYGSR